MESHFKASRDHDGHSNLELSCLRGNRHLVICTPLANQKVLKRLKLFFHRSANAVDNTGFVIKWSYAFYFDD